MSRAAPRVEGLRIATIGHRFSDASIEVAAAAPYGVEVDWYGDLGKDDALKAAAGAHGVLLGLAFDLDAAALVRLPACRVVVRYGIGLDNVDEAAAAARSIKVFNVPDYGIEEVATHTMALVLALTRRLDVLAERVRAGRWSDALAGLALDRLSRRTLTVVGAGRIGRAVVDRAAAFFGNVIVHDPYAQHEPWTLANVRWDGDLDAALQRADVLTVHVPSSPSTRRLLSGSRLRALKRGVVLVNCSRGDVLDEPVVIELLREGHIGAAGLDVFATEPRPSAQLLALPNVWPTPHAAWYSREAVVDLRHKAAVRAASVLAAGGSASAGSPNRSQRRTTP